MSRHRGKAFPLLASPIGAAVNAILVAIVRLVDWSTVKRYVRLFATYVLIALALVLVYAPWGRPYGLALRPSDPNILRAGLSIIIPIALAGVFGASTYFALKDPDVKLLEPTKVIDDDEVVPVLEEYVEAPYVGGIAADALEQVRSAARKRSRLDKVIVMQFEKGSLSWEKFNRLVEMAERNVLRNAALVANNVQSFDREGYHQARRGASDDQQGARSGQLALYDQALADMRKVVEANDQILLEMGKLELELGKLETADAFEENSQTVEELQSLIENTRYYR